ncbi:hypothetical protein N7520_007262 [Penicillium odoratum]|uniref:uncharacterized protein n=1 Tax=Penicillium odoratum TaxID=1167516 RepID=UPI002546D406|nr:uncharacterized protein N7520_007262 [Penicillium odoratum]KAJ5760106.1 hypothetical protein N7520_007262 [Penicillium odoratum]
MPRWGRPPGARMGRHNGGRPWEEDNRVKEIISEDEDVFGRELVRNGRYPWQQEYGGRVSRRRMEYEDLNDETESVMDGGDYDLYENGDSTVAYAVQLAMRDKEDQLVDTALERIRRAQMLGKKNVRLSKRELAALERKRQHTDNPSAGAGTRTRSRQGSVSNSRPSSRRNGHTVPPEQNGAYPPFAPDAGWNRNAGSGRPTSSSSNRPRTPTMQSLRPQQSNSPLRPPYSPFSDRVPPNNRPQSMHPSMYARPLPDDPQWAPPYYNPMQMNTYASEQPPFQPQLPTDLRVGPQSRMSYTAGMSPIQAQNRPSVDGRPLTGTSQSKGSPPPENESETSSEEETGSDEDSDVQIVGVVECQPPSQPPGIKRRPVAGAGKGRQRSS